jgi:hypothetical protein
MANQPGRGGATQEAESRDSRAAITDLIHRYAYNVRNRRGADCAALFTTDAVFEIREANPADPAAARLRKRLSGRDEIRDYVAAATGSGIIVVPLIHNLLIDVHGNEAHSNCIMTTRTWPSGHEMIGEYHDSLRRESGWLFSARIYTIFKSTPA